MENNITDTIPWSDQPHLNLGLLNDSIPTVDIQIITFCYRNKQYRNIVTTRIEMYFIASN